MNYEFSIFIVILNAVKDPAQYDARFFATLRNDNKD